MNRIFESLIESTSWGRKATEAIEFKNVVSKNLSRKKAVKATAKIASKFAGLKESDIRQWRQAHQMALLTKKPSRTELYRIYKDALLNDHLKSVVKVRLEKLLKSEFQIVDAKTGEIDTEVAELFKRSWFWQFLTYSWNANLFGFSLIQFGDLVESNSGIIDYEICDVEEFPREHAKPEQGIIVRQPNDANGWDYRKGTLSEWLIEVGDKKDLGLLLEACPLAISNKYMGIFWDEFAEMFAAPIRVAKVNSSQETERSKAADMLESMGRNAWGVFDQDTDIEIVESNKKDAYLVYDKRMERNEKGMSKLVLGNTMTVDDGSSHSQSQVHEQVTSDIVDSDKREIMFLINEKLIPFLIKKGYPLEGKKFKWDQSEKLSIIEHAEIDKWLIDYFDIEVDYFKNKYNSSITGYKSPTAEGGADVGK